MEGLKVIARIHNDFTSKFGIPRQSGILNKMESRIVFEHEYADINAVRGLEEFSHIWVLWNFSENQSGKWSPTVRPPRLGGNKRVGVFATRSPFRPNNIGMSSLRLVRIEHTGEKGPVLVVTGADMMNNTPIYDIKPFIPYSDNHLDAAGSFSDEAKDYRLNVEISDEIKSCIPHEKYDILLEILAQDPRPAYHQDENRIYAFEFAYLHIEFRVSQMTLQVISISEEIQ